jgi:ACR3 family arsenite transporter
LRAAELQSGKTVLAPAIAGSMGNAMTQMARALDARHAVKATTIHEKVCIGTSLVVPFNVLLTSVMVFIVVPLLVGITLRMLLMRRYGQAWFEDILPPKFAPVTIAALLGTLVLIFAFQSDNITGRFCHVVLIAIPITLQVYLNAGLAYGLMKWLKVEHSVAAPGALIGASNFFELAVATAIALFGP